LELAPTGARENDNSERNRRNTSQPKMGTLERLPAELLSQILDDLSWADIPNLRLVSRSVGSFAYAIAFKEVCFII
jgi:hypothetical protein